jgi:hypothetical protein
MRKQLAACGELVCKMRKSSARNIREQLFAQYSNRRVPHHGKN